MIKAAYIDWWHHVNQYKVKTICHRIIFYKRAKQMYYWIIHVEIFLYFEIFKLLFCYYIAITYQVSLM